MKHIRSRPAMTVLALVVMSLLAACGGDGASDTTATSAPTVTSATTSTTEAPGTGALTDEYSLQIARNSAITVDTSEFVAEAPFKIATIVQGPINGWGTIFDLTMNRAMEDSGKFDMDARLYVPWDFDVENQANGIEDAIAQNVDAILLTSLSRAGLAASVERATEAGIPVVLCMAGTTTDKFVAEVASNMPRMGYDGAMAIIEELNGEGKVVMLNGIAGVDAAEFWKAGAHAAFDQYPGIEIVAEQDGNWSTADALEVFRTILVQEPEIDGIWIGGFEMGVGVIAAYREAGLEVPFIGGTSISNGFLREAIAGEIDFFVAQFPAAGAAECVQTVIDVLEGTPVQKYTDMVDLMTGVEPITPENILDHYREQFNDDFVGPQLFSDDIYQEAGF